MQSSRADQELDQPTDINVVDFKDGMNLCMYCIMYEGCLGIGKISYSLERERERCKIVDWIWNKRNSWRGKKSSRERERVCVVNL